MDTFFHVAPILLSEGSVILPGNFGRIVKGYTPKSVNFDILTRETIFEQVRQEEFKEKPSRLQCIFLVETLEQAIHYRNQHASTCLIYEVGIDSTNLPIHRGSYTFNISEVSSIVEGKLMPPPPSAVQADGYYNGLPKLARAYWNTDPSSSIEILINAPATVIKHHDSA